MRDFKGMKRQRGRNRKPGGNGGNANSANPNRSWDSQGPENIKVRGNAQTVYERYQQLARDAGSAGDRVLAENYLQHAEHYFRVLRALQPQRPVSEIAARELSNQGYDIDFEDETGAQAAAFLAAQQAADRAAQGQDNRDGEGGQNRNEGQPSQNREWRDRDNNQDRDRPQNRDRDYQNRDRDQNRDRHQNRDVSSADGESRAEGEGGRRETRRERWERRREERNRRFEAEGAQGEAPAETEVDAEAPIDAAMPAGAVEDAPVTEPTPTRTRRTRSAPRDEADTGDEAIGLPGFLTRAPASAPSDPVTPTMADAEDAPTPKRRAPRRKVEAPVEEG